VRVLWPKRCPRCGSRDLVQVLYGTPAEPSLRRLWERGEVMLRPGRCGDGAPGWACRECGLEYLDMRAEATQPLNVG
jgi:hypothetical protein